MLFWIILIAAVLLLFGGFGYGYRDTWGGYYSGAPALSG